MSTQLAAWIDVYVVRADDAEIDEPHRVMNWLKSDRHWTKGHRGGFGFAVCSEHLPENCPEGCKMLTLHYAMLRPK